jgi:hypothetical protein
LQIINKQQVSLDFEVAKFGPSGVGSVEVYLTTDEGASWDVVPIPETMITLPLAGQLQGSNVAPHGTVVVPLPHEEKTYGIYLVVKSRAGLGKPPPRPGVDVPQIRVEVDSTPPDVKLMEPRPDPNRPDTLILTWQVTDRNQADNPISIEWAERPEGPWQFINSPELPNTGWTTWNITRAIPPNVYLKLTARDRAHNTAYAQTKQPVLVDLSKPEVSRVSVNLQAGPTGRERTSP